MYYGERFNSYTHLIGLILAVFGTVLLIIHTSLNGGCAKSIVGVSIYAGSLIFAFLFSTLYHSIRPSKAKIVLQYLDRICIFLLIAGSYTPFTLITLPTAWGWSIFGVVWGLALIGILLNIFVKKELYSLIVCLLMGWLILIAIKPLIANMSATGIFWLTLGGLFYSGGVYWFINDTRIKHAHGYWHICVLLGAISQYICVYFYAGI